jgi:hypothetical protein
VAVTVIIVTPAGMTYLKLWVGSVHVMVFVVVAAEAEPASTAGTARIPAASETAGSNRRNRRVFEVVMGVSPF